MTEARLEGLDTVGVIAMAFWETQNQKNNNWTRGCQRQREGEKELPAKEQEENLRGDENALYHGFDAVTRPDVPVHFVSYT